LSKRFIKAASCQLGDYMGNHRPADRITTEALSIGVNRLVSVTEQLSLIKSGQNERKKTISEQGVASRRLDLLPA
jgi:hypothetical protein